MSDEFPVYGSNGKLQGNLTGNFGQVPNSINFGDVFAAFNPLPSLTNGFAPSSTSPGAIVKSSGGTSTGGNVAANGAPANAVGTPAATEIAGTSVVSGSAGDYFLPVRYRGFGVYFRGRWA
jgi:hypothetical protein